MSALSRMLSPQQYAERSRELRTLTTPRRQQRQQVARWSAPINGFYMKRKIFQKFGMTKINLEDHKYKYRVSIIKKTRVHTSISFSLGYGHDAFREENTVGATLNMLLADCCLQIRAAPSTNV